MAVQSDTEAVVLRVRPWGEGGHLVDVFTPDSGILTLVKRGGRMANQGVRLPAIVYPLAWLRVNYSARRGEATIATLVDAEPVKSYSRLVQNPARVAVALYVADLLLALGGTLIAASELFDFTTTLAQRLDDEEAKIALLPLAFTVQTAGYLGYRPSGEYGEEMPYFDLEEGCFCPVRPRGERGLDAEEAAALCRVLQGGIDTPAAAVHKQLRPRLLRRAIQYLRVHTGLPLELKSLGVLEQMFG